MVALTNKGHQVAALDVVKADLQPESVHFIRCDLLDVAGLSSALNEFSPDMVFHLAARTDLNDKDDLNGYAANITGVSNLLDAISSTASVRRVIYTSSQLVCRIGYVPRNEVDYRPNTMYGESKVLTEKLVREADGGGKQWMLVRPTTVWGPGMSAHYQRFLSMIERGHYFHVGRSPRFKSYSYIGNIVHQYIRLMDAPAEAVRGKTFYLADYEPIDLVAWADAFQRALSAPRIPVIPERLARCAARFGDIIQALGAKNFPFTSFRLNNVLMEYVFDLSATREVVGDLPFSMDEGVRHTAEWFKAKR